MKIKLACADFTFPLLPHDDVLTLIASLGIRGVDIGLFERRSHLQPSDQFKNVGRSARTLKKKLDARGLKAADVFLQVDDNGRTYAINHPQAARRRKARDWFQRSLEYAAVCGARHVSLSPGVYFESEPKAKSLARGRDELLWRIEQARPYGIVMGVEPHIGSIAPRPKSALRLVGDTPGLTYTLDYGHFARAGVPDAEVEPLIAHASHFHVRGARRGSLQTTFADNTIDFARIVKVMKKTGYRGYLGLEYVWTVWENCNRVDNLSETILFRDYLKSLDS
jgi:sugar phosphate isomerase/epimerase